MGIDARSKWVLLLAVLAGACSAKVQPNPQLEATLSAPRVFDATADAYVDKNHSSSNYGTTSTLFSDGNPVRVAYVRFDVTGLTSPIASAHLGFYALDGTTAAPLVYTTSNSWSETGINWNNRPALVADTGARLGAVAAGTWVDVDVTSLVQTNGTFSFALTSSSSDGLKMSSREGSSPPRLAITPTASPDGATSPSADMATSPGTDMATAPPPSGSYSWQGVTFPWKIFDGTIPDTPVSSTGKTWYVDSTHGTDSNAGTSISSAKKTINGLLNSGVVAAGDTVLLAGGIYREYLNLSTVSGKAGAPVTFGSYGRGTGAPIIDGGLKPSWTRYSAQGQTTVWQANLSAFTSINAKQPVLGVYVNNGTAESALRETIHGQLSSYGGGALPPSENQTNVADGSSKWYFDPAAKVLYADFGGTLGAADPNAADVSVLFDSHTNSNSQMVVLMTKGHDYLSFVGLTIRASSWGGVYSEASHALFDHCDFKFNGGAGFLFGSASTDTSVTDNRVTYSRVWMNVLNNWPRFNNGNTGGGWPAAATWANQSNALSLGNIVYENGGEGVDFTTTLSADGVTPHIVSGNVVRNNIVYDNFSVNVYFCSTQGVLVDQSFVFTHPLDANQTFSGLLTINAGYGQDLARRLVPINVGLGDEPGSAFDGNAHLQDIKLTNNIFVGGKRQYLDWDDGTKDQGHGLKNCFIANNTFIAASQAVPDGSRGYGMYTQPKAGKSTNSFVENNLFASIDSTDLFVRDDLTGSSGTAGITLDYNVYSGPGAFSVQSSAVAFTGWRSAYPAWDAHSLDAAAMIQNPAEFSQTKAQKRVYDWSQAMPMIGSPSIKAGTSLQQISTDFTSAARTNGSGDVGALGQH